MRRCVSQISRRRSVWWDDCYEKGHGLICINLFEGAFFFFLPKTDPMIHNMTPNVEGKMGFCWKYLRIDPRKACDCFGEGIYLSVTWDYLVTRHPDESYSVRGR